MTSQESRFYSSLVGLAEYFRKLSPPDIPKCVRCLQAILDAELPSAIKARTHFQMGDVLITYTKNQDLAVRHLEYAWKLCQSDAYDDFMFEAASLLAVLYKQRKRTRASILLLSRCIELSQHSLFWHCRLLFQLAQIYVSEGMYKQAIDLLGTGVNYAKISRSKYYEVLFLTSQCTVFLVDENFPEGVHVMRQVESVLNTLEDGTFKFYLVVFFLAVKVCFLLKLGRMKTAEPHLRRLKRNVVALMTVSSNIEEHELLKGTVLCWMPKEHIRILVCVITVMYRIMIGEYVNEVVENAESTLAEIRKLKTANECCFLIVLEGICIQQMVMCKIVRGHFCGALSLISNACSLYSKHFSILEKRRPQLHVLLGMYAMAVGCIPDAEQQFNAALQLTQQKELKTVINLNLILLLINERRSSDANKLLVNINPANFPSCSHSMKTAAYLIFGLLELIDGRYSDGKQFLNEVLKMANAEYIHQLSSCSSVLLGYVFLSQHKLRECSEVLTASMDTIVCTGDAHARLWVLSLFKELYRINSDAQREEEFSRMCSSLSEKLIFDRSEALKMSDHLLVRWISGSIPSFP